MRRLMTALFIFLFAFGFVAYHTYEVLALSDDLSVLCTRVEEAYALEDWDSVLYHTDKIKERWEESRFWATLTLNTARIEEIEISLSQSQAYAKLHAKPDFIGEFTMFRMLTDHLPHQEGFDIKELL